MASDTRFCGVSRLTITAPPPPVVQGRPLLSTGMGCTCAGATKRPDAVLDPARQLAGDGGDDLRAAVHGPGQAPRDAGSAGAAPRRCRAR